MATEEQFFSYRFDRRFALFWLPFGAKPRRDGVRLGPGGFLATFGFFRLGTPLANLQEAHITRGYRWWTAVGARGSMVDDGLTFGTNRDAGVCIHFLEKVPSPLRRRGHSALTVTVADLEGLAAAVNAVAGARGTS
jgi:hypothetical protein